MLSPQAFEDAIRNHQMAGEEEERQTGFKLSQLWLNATASDIRLFAQFLVKAVQEEVIEEAFPCLARLVQCVPGYPHLDLEKTHRYLLILKIQGGRRAVN